MPRDFCVGIPSEKAVLCISPLPASYIYGISCAWGCRVKKFFFYAFLVAALCLFFLLACARTDCLYDLVAGITAADTSLPAGSILCYGRQYENAVTDDTLSDYLGLDGYPAFKDKIEDFAAFSSLQGEYCELAILRLYRSSDAADGALFLERRIRETSRALKVGQKAGYAETAYVRTYGNIVVLYMMPDNAAVEKKLRAAM